MRTNFGDLIERPRRTAGRALVVNSVIDFLSPERCVVRPAPLPGPGGRAGARSGATQLYLYTSESVAHPVLVQVAAPRPLAAPSAPRAPVPALLLLLLLLLLLMLLPLCCAVLCCAVLFCGASANAVRGARRTRASQGTSWRRSLRWRPACARTRVLPRVTVRARCACSRLARRPAQNEEGDIEQLAVDAYESSMRSGMLS